MGKVEAQCRPLLGSRASLHLDIWRQMNRESKLWLSVVQLLGDKGSPTHRRQFGDKSEAIARCPL